MGLVEGLGRAQERPLKSRLLLRITAYFWIHAGVCVEDDGCGRIAVMGFQAMDVQREGRESGGGPIVAQYLCSCSGGAAWQIVMEMITINVVQWIVRCDHGSESHRLLAGYCKTCMDLNCGLLTISSADPRTRHPVDCWYAARLCDSCVVE